jgi:hypothetical protein
MVLSGRELRTRNDEHSKCFKHKDVPAYAQFKRSSKNPRKYVNHKVKLPSTYPNYSYTGLCRDAANFTEHCFKLLPFSSVMPHAAIVFVTSVGAPLQIDAGWRIENKN